ncbi:glycosyltransferase family 4 protein, partial [Escherichia coli]
LKPDCIIANFHLTAFLVFLLPRSIRKYYYIQAYEVVFYKSIIRKLIALITYCLPIKKIINHRDLLPKILNNHIGIIPAGIDQTIFYPRNYSGVKKNIGVVGRKEIHKGTKNIIDALINWEQKHLITFNIALYLSKDDEVKLKEHDVDYNFYPIYDDIQLAKFYRVNDLVIATGLVEDGAFHYPCAEAMSCGCAVISNYAPLADTNSTLKIPTFTVENLINRLNYYMDMSDEEIFSEIKMNFSHVKEHDWEIVGRNFYEIIKNN